MKEKAKISLLVIMLLIIGWGQFYYLQLLSSEFTFSSATLELDGNIVRERLSFVPDKPYHTLYRYFASRIMLPGERDSNAEYIWIDSVECKDGIPYYKDYSGRFVSDAASIPLEYTEPNEYGCSFGGELGFRKGAEHTIAAEYVLNPSVLFEFNGAHYIKFVAYQKRLHPHLIIGDNFEIIGNGLVKEGIFSGLPGLDTVIYIPYEPESLEGYEIRKVNRLDFGEEYARLILAFIISMLPALVCLLTWLFFGREKSEGDYPKELSQYPKERKAWEISAYFQPPFGTLDRNFLPSVILDFYSRKIIDLSFRKTGLLSTKDVFIKLLAHKKQVDEVEEKIISFLGYIESVEKPKDGFFSIRKASGRLTESAMIAIKYRSLYELIRKKSKDYIDYTGRWVLSAGLALALFIQLPMGVTGLLGIIVTIIILIIGNRSALFIRFKKDYYLEFQEWKGFKRYLSNSDSIRRAAHLGVVVWEKYLVYATAMGIGKKVLSEMKSLKVIEESEYKNMRYIYTPTAFGSFSSPGSSGSGGGGGAGGGMGGGGGIGGGGGGGR